MAAPKAQVHHRVFGEQGQHVIEEWNACLHRRLPLTIDLKLQRDASLARVSLQLRLPFLHLAQLSKPR